jgi:plasmid stabilization system protein ParE
VRKRKVTWTQAAIDQFNNIIEFIRLDSEQNADKVKEKIPEKIYQLSDDRIVHRKDPYKKNNDGNYLYFEILKYLVYYHSSKEVFIIRIRHTSMEPKQY